MADESRLLPLIAAGDAAAFGQWLAGAELPLRRSLRPFAAQVDVESVLQETLLRIWQVSRRFQPDGRPNALLRFAVTTTRNLALSELRRSRPAPEDLEVLERELAAVGNIAPAMPDPLLRAAIRECRERLPAKPRQVFDERMLHGAGNDDRTLAERLGMRLNTFLQNVTRARKLILDCLDKKGVELEDMR